MSVMFRRGLVGLVMTLGLATAATTPAVAHPEGETDGGTTCRTIRATPTSTVTTTGTSRQPANIDVVSKLKLKNVVPEKIADVGVLKDYAYLAAWGVVTCKYNGVHVVDIKDVENPKEVAFIGAKHGSYPGEGIQTLHIDTPKFNGDILVSNNEKCNDKAGFGGMNIYDVTNPKAPHPAGRGHRRLHRQRPGQEGRQRDPQRLRLGRGRQGVRRHRRQRGGQGRRHHGHHRPEEAVPDRGVRPRRAVPADQAGGAEQPRRDLPARHGRQGDRRTSGDDAVLLGCRLRQGRRHRRPEPRRTWATPTSPTRTPRPPRAD